MEDKYIESNESLMGVLKSLDKVYTMVFLLEMVLKVTAYGPKNYLSDAEELPQRRLVLAGLHDRCGQTLNHSLVADRRDHGRGHYAQGRF